MSPGAAESACRLDYENADEKELKPIDLFLFAVIQSQAAEIERLKSKVQP